MLHKGIFCSKKALKPLQIKDFQGFLMSNRDEKDTFAFLAESFELSHFTRQFKSKYCFFLSFRGNTRYFNLDTWVQIVKFFRFQSLFYAFLIFLSSLKVQSNDPQLRIATGFITKTPLKSKPKGFRFQWCFA